MEPTRLEDHRRRTCSQCAKSKPASHFRRKPNGDPEAACATCRDRRTRSTEKVVYNRARQRATEELIKRYAEEFAELVEAWKPFVREELERLGGPAVKLRPGKKQPGQTVLDRIMELCPTCATAHQKGHACSVCGSTEESPVRVVKMSDGQFKLSRSEVTVLQP